MVVDGQNALLDETGQRWFCRFRSGNFSVEDTVHDRRLISKKIDETILEAERDQPTDIQE